jgi:hypothetical protein
MAGGCVANNISAILHRAFRKQKGRNNVMLMGVCFCAVSYKDRAA